MNITTSQTNGVVVVAADGELDIVTAGQLDTELVAGLEQASLRLVLDLSAVSFMDSTGLGTVVKALKRCREKDVEFRVVVATERVRKVFDITGLNTLISLTESLEGALGA